MSVTAFAGRPEGTVLRDECCQLWQVDEKIDDGLMFVGDRSCPPESLELEERFFRNTLEGEDAPCAICS
jgi:hypothetical protein